MRIRTGLLVASVFLISFAAGAQAAVNGPGIPGAPRIKVDGGPLGIPIKTALSINNLLENINLMGVETADDGKKAAGQRSGLAKMLAAVKKAMALYNGHMERKTGDFNLGNTHKNKMHSAFSRLASASLIAMTALKATTGPINRATLDMYSNLPRSMYDRMKDSGIGGTHLEALAVMKELCQAEGLPTTVSQRLALNPAFGGCSTDEDKDGMAVSVAKLASAPKGLRVGPGGRENQVFISHLRLRRFGQGVQSIMAFNGYRNMRELLQAELKQIQGPDGRIVAAVYRPDRKDDGGFIKASIADNPIITEMRGLGREMTAANETGGAIQALQNRFSIKNPGEDIYKAAATQSREFTGDEQPYDAGNYPSASAATEIATGAAGRQAEKATNAGNTEAEAGITAVGLSGNMAQNRATSLDANKVPEASVDSFGRALDALAMVIDSQEFRTFVANLDPKVMADVTAWVQEDLRDCEIQVAANYNAHLYRNNIPVMYAVNGDKFPADMKGILASVGVDGETMLPNGDKFDVDRKFQMATLSPILDMKQYDPIEPVAIQLALHDSIKTVIKIAQTEPITAAIKATPIVAISH